MLLGGPASLRAAARIARLADGWNPMNVQRDSLRHGVGLLREAFATAGRDPDSLIVRVSIREATAAAAYSRSDADALRAEVAELTAVGATDIKLYVSGLVSDPADVEGVLTWISDVLDLRD